MHRCARFSLPAGWLDQNGAREHAVEVRALCGADEEWLHALPDETPQVAIAVALLGFLATIAFARYIIRQAGGDTK